MSVNYSEVKTGLGRLHQYIAVLTCCLITCLYAVSVVWPSYAIRMLNSAESPLKDKHLTSSETALLASLPLIGSVIGKIPASYLIHMFGTKNCGIAIGIPVILAWLLNIFSTSLLSLFAARFLMGFSGGFGTINSTIFIAEIAETAIRGKLSTAIPVSLTMGVLFSYILGASFSYGVINIIMVTISVIYTAAVCFIPESPVHLMRYEKDTEAAKSMAWYRGASADSHLVKDSLNLMRINNTGIVKPQYVELKDININNEYSAKDEVDSEMEILQKPHANQNKSVENQEQISSWHFLRKSSSSRRALLSVLFLFILQTFMGATIVTTYAGQIMMDAAPSMSPDACSIFLGVFTLIGTLIPMHIIERAGRKILMIVTSLIVAVLMALIAVLMQGGFGPGWLPAAILCFNVIIFNMGPGTVPYVWTTELFLPEVRGLSTTICLQTFALTACVCLALFPWLKGLLGLPGVFYIFSLFSLKAAIFTCLVFPETKGITVQEIHARLNSNRKPKIVLSN